MKSWKAVRFGMPEEALRIQESDIPVPGDGQIAGQIRAASVSLPDRLMIQGHHPLIKSTPFSPGIEVAGIVSAAGNGAPFAVGDRAMTTTAYAAGWGGFAEYCLADATRTVLVPSHMTDVDAAGFLVPYKNAQVIAVSSSSAKLEFCREIGADHVINYKTDDILDRVNHLTQGKGADVIFDPVGGILGNQASKAIARRGRFLLISFARGSWVQLDPLDIAVRDYSVVGVFSASLTLEELARTHSEVIALAQEGRIYTPIRKVFPFQDVPAALTYLTSDDLMGRVIVEIS